MTGHRGGGEDSPKAVLGRLAAALRELAFTEEVVDRVLAIAPGMGVRPVDRLAYVRRLIGDGGLSTVVRLLTLGLPVPVAEVAEALGSATADELCGLRLVEIDGGVVRAVVRVTPYDDLLLAHDAEHDGELDSEHVGGVGPAARTLARLTIRRPGVRALDLGSGCGVQALLAARHAAHVVAVDLNPRALWFTELNAALNGLSNVECRQGNLFEPVRGEEFGLIVANPPFVISPDRDFTFRDGGLEGDGMSRAVVSGTAGALAPGGTGHVLCNWIVGDGESGAPVAGWLPGADCDLLVLHYETVDTLTYAARWAHLGSTVGEDADGRVDRWLDYYRTAGIAAVGLGAVVLRRRPAASCWTGVVEMTSGPSADAAGQLTRMIEGADREACVGDDTAALAAVFALVDGHQLNQSLTFAGDRYAPGPAELVCADGVGLAGDVGPLALHIVLRIDGRSTLGEIVDRAWEDTGLDREELGLAGLECSRRLLAAGFLRLVAPC